MSRFFSSRFDALEPYVPGEQPQDRRYIKLNTNESPYPPSPRAIACAAEAAQTLQLYSDPECRKLIDTAAECFGLDSQEILFGNGSDEILNFAFMAFCDETCPAIFPDITYGFYSVFGALNRIPCREIPLMPDFTLRPEDYYDAGGTIFIANPNAPTGIALTRQQICGILEANSDHVVVIDEAYVDFGAESCAELIPRYPNLLVVRTFSKSRNLAGGRLGFALGNRALIRDLNTLKYSTNPYNVNRMTMAAGIGALEDAEYFQVCCESIMDTREKTVRALNAMGFSVLDSRANFLFVKHPDHPGLRLYQQLKQQGILIRHFETPRLKDYNRITIGSPEQMNALLAALRTLMEEKP